MSDLKKEEMLKAVQLAIDEFDLLYKEREPIALFKDYISTDKREKEIYFHTLQSNLFKAKEKLLFFNSKLDRATQLVMEYNLEKIKK